MNLTCLRYSHELGHYTQLVWAETNRVGCGFTSYSTDNRRINYYVCNYGPAGNFAGKEVYKMGPACSQCPVQSVCSTQYPNLCGKSIVFFSFLFFFGFFFFVPLILFHWFYFFVCRRTNCASFLCNDVPFNAWIEMFR